MRRKGRHDSLVLRQIFCSILGLSLLFNNGYCQAEPPRAFDQSPLTGSKVVGDSKTDLCMAQSSPEPEYSWSKDGQVIAGATGSSFRVNDIQRNDAGAYRCVARNQHGALLSKEGILYVDYFETFNNTNVIFAKPAQQGQYLLIELPSVQGRPAPTVFWLCGSTRIRIDERHYITLDNHLVLLSVQENDASCTYSATAMNVVHLNTVQTPEFTLNVAADATAGSVLEFVIRPKDTNAEIAAPFVRFECVANARDIDSVVIQWFRGGVLLNNTASKYTFDTYQRVLMIKQVVTTDAGHYECRATLNGGSSITAAASLSVYTRPEFTPVDNAILEEDYGSTVTIDCTAAGNPTPSIMWYFNARPVNELSNSRVSVMERGTLTIESLDASDAGIYQCFIRNEIGGEFRVTWLKILSMPPEIVVGPQSLSVMEGEDITLQCHVTGKPTPTIQWYKDIGDGVQLIPTNLQQTELVILSVKTENSGNYTCRANNTRGVASKSAIIKVTMHTRIIGPPLDIRVIKSSSLTLPCEVSHDPSISITRMWYRYIPPDNRQERLPTPGSSDIVRENGALFISQVSGSDKGRYECSVVSSGGNDTASAQIDVMEVPRKPQITSIVLASMHPRSVVIGWIPGFDGNAPLRYFSVQYTIIQDGGGVDSEWQTYPVRIEPSSRSHTVQDLQPAKKYRFRMSAVNEVGEGQFSDTYPSHPQTILMPQEAPSGPPRGCFAESQSSTTIMLQWQIPEESHLNGVLRGYLVQYQLHNYPNDTRRTYNVTDFHAMSIELSRLLPYGHYELGIAAYNEAGPGPFCSVSAWTQEGVPTASPTEVTATAISSTSFYITWQPPDQGQINGVNSGYRIRLVLIFDNGTSHTVMHSNVPRDLLNLEGLQNWTQGGLEKYQQYNISVVALSGKGEGLWSAPIKRRTLEDRPGRINNLQFIDVKDTSVRVGWQLPSKLNGVIIGFTLSYWKKNDTSTEQRIRIPADQRAYTILSLSPTTWYTIAVAARTRKGTGPRESADVESGVPPEPPGPPRSLAVTNIRSSSVILQFRPGYDGKTSITYWIVEALEGSSSTWAEIYRISAPDADSFKVENLRPYTDYSLRLVAENIVNRSEPSEKADKFQTLQTRPGAAPGNVTVRSLDSTAVRVSWTPLPVNSWNGVPKGYTILFKMTDYDSTFMTVNLPDINLDSHVIRNLQEWMSYDVKMQAYNQLGSSDDSDVTTEMTRESVPTAGPVNVSAIAVSSTAIDVSWDTVPLFDRNGLIRGYKIKYGSIEENIPAKFLAIESNQRFNHVIQDLRMYVRYEIQVLAYTRMGDGTLSLQAAVRTKEGLPGAPIIIYFPLVTYSVAKIVWEPPVEPNGIITNYTLSYRRANETDEMAVVIYGLNATEREYTTMGLSRESKYVFYLAASTHLGVGDPANVTVITVLDRNRPDRPSKPIIGTSQREARSITINWLPGADGNGPLRNFTIQYKPQGREWITLADVISPRVNSYTVQELHPNNLYAFRAASTNDIGMSDYSLPSDEVKTLEDKPDGAPQNLLVVPLTTTAVQATWQPPRPESLNGDLHGYIVQYRQSSMASYHEEDLQPSVYTLTLLNLTELVHYEVRVLAYNAKGRGPPSTPATIYVGEAAPNAAPLSVTASPLSATSLSIAWQPPPEENQNGALSGYKVFYSKSRLPLPDDAVQLIVVEHNAVLEGLDMYSDYSVAVLAYNLAGDGPKSLPVYARTEQGKPGIVSELRFSNITYRSVHVSWTPPNQPNGIITHYNLEYKDNNQGARSVQVSLYGHELSHRPSDLEAETNYRFVIRAETLKGLGDPRTGLVTTRSPPGTPTRPSKPVFATSDDPEKLKLRWNTTAPFGAPVTHTVIEMQEEPRPGEVIVVVWVEILRKMSSESEAEINLHNLKPGSPYRFRVLAYNEAGMSEPGPASDVYLTPATASLMQEPVYKQWWFLVIIALTGVVLILVVISLLCLFRRHRKGAHKANTTTAVPAETEDGGFGTYEMNQNRRSIASRNASSRNGTLRSMHRATGGGTLTRSAPRPSPASVMYSDDESTVKPPLPDETSSLSDKPSDLDDSTEPSDEESEPESDKIPTSAASFQSPRYVNDPVRQSWYHINPANAYSYTDSEQESSHYAMSLQGGQVLPNNQARSRAPLPGFSSFV